VEVASIVKEPDADAQLRAHVHGMWASVAQSWGENAEYADARGALVTKRMLELTLPQPGERVLELACGPGGLGIAAAERVGPDGEVVVSDVVEEMTRIAAARASAAGHTNVSARVLDLEDIDEPDGAYDVVLCREGLMFAVDPARALGEIHRVLRPGGRAVIAVWGPREHNPWLAIVMDAVSEQLGRPMPPPGVPGPFALQDADRLAALLAGAGLEDVALGALPVPLRAASFDAWWARTSALAGPLAKLLASLPAPALDQLRARARRAVTGYETTDGLELPGETLVARGSRPWTTDSGTRSRS
jgi:ubiquinone/menaquinone biosynthesis C-methylase UbiE